MKTLLSATLKSLRKEYGLTQEDLAPDFVIASP